MSKDIRLGFEIESLYNKTGRKDLIRKIREINPEIITGNDYSLHGWTGKMDTYGNRQDDCGIEIKTPPLPKCEAIVVLDKVFSLVGKYGYTNKTCGLHLNLSTVNEEKRTKFNPFLFCVNPLWAKMGEDFQRNRNEFCLNRFHKFHQKSLFSNIINVGRCTEKYSCVNLGHWNKPLPKSRVEIRIMGNKGYHNRLDEIVNYTEKIIKLFNASCRSFTPIEV